VIPLFGRLIGGLRAVFHRERVEQELDEELRGFLQTAADDKVRAGLTESAAMRAARIELGSVEAVKEHVRDVGWESVLEQLWRDVQYASRTLRRSRGFTAVAVISLALAIGFNTTLFTIVSGMGSTPPVDQSDQVVSLTSLDSAGRTVGVSYSDFQDWRHLSQSFEGLAAHSVMAVNLTDRDLAADRVAGAYISATTFSLLREHPIVGRDFRPDDDRPGAEPVLIIAASVWKGRYDGDPGIIGRVITANGRRVTVVGVRRDGFRFPLVHDLWLPLAVAPGLERQARDARGLRVFGRLATGVRLAQAWAELDTIMAGLSKTYPTTNANVRPGVEPLTRGFDLRNPWNAALIAVGIVLLIACANVANLLLARAVRRAPEIAIRTSLGATRRRLVQQLVIESLLMAAMAGVAGLGAAALGVRIWLASMPAASWPYWYHFAINTRVLSYLSGISLGSVLFLGVGPAWSLSGSFPEADLSHTGRGRSAGPRARRWSTVLLSAELALTLSLLAGAGLLARTLLAVYRADSIVDTDPVILAGLDLPPQQYATPAQRIALYSQLEERVSTIPSVQATALASGAPFYSAAVWSVILPGQAGATPASQTSSYVLIGPRYFDTLGLRLLRGRVFTDLDGTPGHETVIVNELFASKYLAGTNPLGQRIRLADPTKPDPKPPWLTIVGVSPTVREHYAQEFDPVVYVPYRLNPLANMVLMTRASADAAALAPALREQFRQLDPDLPLLDIQPLNWLLSGTRFANQVFATLFGIAAALGLLLAAVGLYAVVTYDVGQRTREIGIRLALGAHPRQVVWLLGRRVLTPLAWGLTIGLGGAWGVGRLVRGMLIRTSPDDPLTLVSISLVLTVVALIAALRPARRSTRLDPVTALRYE